MTLVIGLKSQRNHRDTDKTKIWLKLVEVGWITLFRHTILIYLLKAIIYKTIDLISFNNNLSKLIFFEFVQPLVTDTEVMGNFMDHDFTYQGHHLLSCPATSLDRPLKDGDFVR